MITKYGYSTLGIAFIIVLILLIISYFTTNNIIRYSSLSVALFIAAFTLNFFRDPSRISPEADNVIVSPADGKVLVIKDIEENLFIKDEAKQISIFMSPLNVHVNRIPIDGKVDYVNFVKGEYLVAFHDKADERNERNIVGITSKYGKVLFTQVAGFVARRIISELEEGEIVSKGNRFGMIKFGSRVDVVADKKVAVKGERRRCC